MEKNIEERRGSYKAKRGLNDRLQTELAIFDERLALA